MKGALQQSPAPPVHPLSAALPAGLCGIFPFMPEILQRVEAGIHLKYDVSALSAISPVGPAGGHIELSPKGNMAVPSLSALYKNFRSIGKHFSSLGYA